MKPPVRMVCGVCLRSLELEPDSFGRLPTVCPECGGTIDSRLSEMETPHAGFVMPADSPTTDHGGRDRANGRGGEPRWSQTWTKGSLGSVGKFQLREQLGGGGFGLVYKAYDARLDRDVALKVLKQLDPGERVMERFFREARAAARLDHPNIVKVLESGFDDGRCWIAYEFVEGRNLAQQLAPSDNDRVGWAVRIVRDLADAIDHAHREGVYHRDLKPANVIIDKDGRPRLTDFGLARRADLSSDLTRDGAVLGTPAYMSPEQAEGRSHRADERSDIYSLGVILYEMLAGRRPFDLPSDLPAWQSRPNGPPPPLRTLNKQAPAELESVCLKALAPDPRDRYPNARAMVRDLDRWLQRKAGKPALSLPLTQVLMGIGGALLLSVGIMAVMQLGDSPERVAPPPAATAGASTAVLPLAGAGTPPAPMVRLSTPTPETAAAEPAASDEPVYFTHEGDANRAFHSRPDCPGFNNSKQARDSLPESEALTRGLRRCKKCLGPTRNDGHAWSRRSTAG